MPNGLPERFTYHIDDNIALPHYDFLQESIENISTEQENEKIQLEKDYYFLVNLTQRLTEILPTLTSNDIDRNDHLKEMISDLKSNTKFLGKRIDTNLSTLYEKDRGAFIHVSRELLLLTKNISTHFRMLLLKSSAGQVSDVKYTPGRIIKRERKSPTSFTKMQEWHFPKSEYNVHHLDRRAEYGYSFPMLLVKIQVQFHTLLHAVIDNDRIYESLKAIRPEKGNVDTVTKKMERSQEFHQNSQSISRHLEQLNEHLVHALTYFPQKFAKVTGKTTKKTQYLIAEESLGDNYQEKVERKLEHYSEPQQKRIMKRVKSRVVSKKAKVRQFKKRMKRKETIEAVNNNAEEFQFELFKIYITSLIKSIPAYTNAVELVNTQKLHEDLYIQTQRSLENLKTYFKALEQLHFMKEEKELFRIFYKGKAHQFLRKEDIYDLTLPENGGKMVLNEQQRKDRAIAMDTFGGDEGERTRAAAHRSLRLIMQLSHNLKKNIPKTYTFNLELLRRSGTVTLGKKERKLAKQLHKELGKLFSLLRPIKTVDDVILIDTYKRKVGPRSLHHEELESELFDKLLTGSLLRLEEILGDMRERKYV